MIKTDKILPKVLVVDDDEQIRKQIQWSLSDEFSVYSAGDRTTAIKIFEKEQPPVVLLDLGLPPHPRDAAEGLKTLEEMLALDSLAKIIIVSGNSERKNALAAVDKGAYDIFPKPVDLGELKIVLNRVIRILALEKENIDGRNQYVSFEDIIGTSTPMQEIFSAIRKVAETDIPVLITGESGTGKELIATAIHNLSKRKNAPFIAINCGAIPATLIESELFGHEKGSFTGASMQRRGRVESAHNGTLFLDEIGDLAPELQVKFLRFLQEKVIERIGGRQSIPVDIRVIAATNRNLAEAVKTGAFREDLYFRLAVVKLEMPPLRERGDDIIQLAEHMAATFAKELRRPCKKFTKTALEAIRKHEWPGNIRELQNRIKNALVFAKGTMIEYSDLDLEAPNGISTQQTLKKAREVMEREILKNTLKDTRGNISKSAKILGISRPTLYELMERYELTQ